MKNLILFICALFLCIGCCPIVESNAAPAPSSHPRSTAIWFSSYMGNSRVVEKINLEGHYYYIYKDRLYHSANCKCNVNLN